ncbi:hypothetical protein [Paenibacillus agri]|uniref:Uncharacterized protein n=1 Tax=Paenibacillus agri TaxID=2744309 RepID=A0A850EL20_9BACL|nr:hypothetical protein [Paenibacillus agri]NUU61096.1 hypothetical protein [Paenibacillus agri]
MINKILILDDKIEELSDLVVKLNQSSELYVKATNDIGNMELFEAMDLLVIDWDLTGVDTDGKICMSLLREVLSKRVVPIIIYSTHSEESIKEVLQDFTPFQLNFIKIVRKGEQETAIEQIKLVLEKSENVIVRISFMWKAALAKALDKSLNTINSRLNDYAISLLQKECELDTQDLSSTVKELLTDLLAGELETLQPNIIQMENHLQEGYESYKWLLQMRKYALPSPTRTIFTGDIFVIGTNQYGIVITPKCDLARLTPGSYVNYVVGYDMFNKLKGDETLEQVKEKTANFLRNHIVTPSEKEYWLFDVPVGEKEINIIFTFGNIQTLRLDEFVEKGFSRVASVKSPYLEDLIQSYSRFQMRVGVPSRPFKKEDKIDKESYINVLSENYANKYVAASKA